MGVFVAGGGGVAVLVGVGVSVGISVLVGVDVIVNVGLGVLVGVAVGSARRESRLPPEQASIPAMMAIETTRITMRSLRLLIVPPGFSSSGPT